MFPKTLAPTKINRNNFKFDNMFVITAMAMFINRSHPSIPRNLFWVLQFLIILTLSTTTFLFLGNSVLLYDIPAGRYAEASKNGTMAIVAFTITIKYSFLLYFQKYMKNLINVVDRDYKLAMDFEEEEKEIVIMYAKKGAKVSWYWLLAALSTSIAFPLKAIFKMGYSYWQGDFKYIPMFDMRYPDRLDILKDIPAMFILLFVLCLMFGCYATTMYIGFDPLVPIFLLHICGQLDILSKRILKIFSENYNEEEINEKLKDVNIKLQDLYGLIENIKNKFTVLFEYNMKTTTFLLPLSLFQVVEDLKRSQLNMEFLSFFVATILHFYMPCYYSDNLLERSYYLREAIYSCGWETHPNTRARKTVLLMMTRTTAPLVLSTIFYTICLDTFAEMCRQSYAIFNIMNAACA
ncbi:uncharacterized protein LOC135074184 [Ostrinia nubilalis]|uniref:uncharacterized protein LOC135074184 n=1 Tax=Ostrinia nubilalis TaxID=29057 RepID=UPI003082649B